MTPNRLQEFKNLYAGLEPQTMMVRHLEELIAELDKTEAKLKEKELQLTEQAIERDALLRGLAKIKCDCTPFQLLDGVNHKLFCKGYIAEQALHSASIQNQLSNKEIK